MTKHRYFPISLYWLPLFAVIIIVMFTIKALIPDIYSGTLDSFRWSFNLIPLATNYLYWALLAPVIFYFRRSLSWQSGQSLGMNLSKIAFFTPAIALLHANLSYWSFIGIYKLSNDLDVSAAIEHIVRTIYAGAVGSYVELWIILGAFYALDYYQKYQQHQLKLAHAEKDLADAKLTSLRMQLNPHFLFNALNSVTSLIDSDKNQAKDMLVEFSTMMRQILSQDKRHSVRLSEDLGFIEQYLAIEKIRFKDRLTFHFQVEPEAESALVPNLLLQPLIENTFKHGFANKVGACEIHIRAKIEEGRLIIHIEDNGIEHPDTNKDYSQGIGLTNIRKRLAQMFGGDYQMTLAPQSTEGMVAVLNLPIVQSNIKTLSEHVK